MMSAWLRARRALRRLFAPAPGAAPLWRMIAAQAQLETRTLLRNGEQLLLTLIIPLLLLAAFGLEPLVNFGAGMSRIDFLTPGIMALAVMSTAFTSQAIATGFERRYGVLKRLGATPLSRTGLIAAKTTTVIAVELLQCVLILIVALAIGWRPNASPTAIVVAAAAHPARYRGVQRPRAADGGHAARRGHIGRGQPGLYRAARRGRRGLPADQVPGGRTTRPRAAADRRVCLPACAACCSRASPSRSGTRSRWWSGPPRRSPSRRGPSGGSEGYRTERLGAGPGPDYPLPDIPFPESPVRDTPEPDYPVADGPACGHDPDRDRIGPVRGGSGRQAVRADTASGGDRAAAVGHPP